MSVQNSQVNMLDNSQCSKQTNSHSQQVTKVVLVQFLHCPLHVPCTVKKATGKQRLPSSCYWSGIRCVIKVDRRKHSVHLTNTSYVQSTRENQAEFAIPNTSPTCLFKLQLSCSPQAHAEQQECLTAPLTWPLGTSAPGVFSYWSYEVSRLPAFPYRSPLTVSREQLRQLCLGQGQLLPLAFWSCHRQGWLHQCHSCWLQHPAWLSGMVLLSFWSDLLQCPQTVSDSASCSSALVQRHP